MGMRGSGNGAHTGSSRIASDSVRRSGIREWNERRTVAQHLLCELVETLDSRRVRYTQNLERA
jgi:hypothetical protein